jgi:hypothetical protein
MVISTNVSVMTRSINVLMSDGTTERFALVAASDGDVHWRHDIFDLTDEGERTWIRHGGLLSVGDVLARIPSCERHVIAWTSEEIEGGADLPDLDIFRRDVRRRAIERLSAELSTARTAV